jgi:hypothetical protein
VGRDQHRRGDRDRHSDRSDRRRRQGDVGPRRSQGEADADPDDEGGEQNPAGPVEAHDPDQLEDHNEQRQPQHDLREARRGPGPAGQQPAAQRDGGVGHRAGNGDQLDRALQIVAEAHTCAARPSFEQAVGSSGPVIL